MLKKLTFFQKNLLLSALFTLLVGIPLIIASFYFEGKVINQTLAQQGEGLGSLLASQFNQETVNLASKTLDVNAAEQKALTATLDHISKNNPNVAQGYVFQKDRLENGLFSAISTPSFLIELGAVPGDQMPDAPPFVAAYNKAIETKKPTASDVYADDLGSWFTVITPVLDENGEVIAMFGFDMSADIIKTSQWTMVKWLSLALLGLFLLVFLIQFINLKRVLKPINELSAAVHKVSAGDLHVELVVKSQDEVGVVVSGFNEMVRKIRDNIKALESAAHQLQTAFAQVSSVSENTSTKAKDILISLEEITMSTEHLALEAESGNHQLLEINTKIEEILKHTSGARDAIQICLNNSDQGIEIIEKLKQKSSETTSITLNVGKKIYNLEGRMRRINDLLSSIQDVAEQTGLLSLNASIEAARAGEHGRGFSVVADEIRKLSTNSKQASEEIASLLKTISQDVGSTGQEMRIAENSLKDQSLQVENTIGSFYQIREQIKKVAAHIQTVNHTIDVVEDSKENLLATVESVSSMSQQTAASVEMIQRNFGEQLELIHSLNDSCQSMQKQAESLTQQTSDPQNQ